MIPNRITDDVSYRLIEADVMYGRTVHLESVERGAGIARQDGRPTAVRSVARLSHQGEEPLIMGGHIQDAP